MLRRDFFKMGTASVLSAGGFTKAAWPQTVPGPRNAPWRFSEETGAKIERHVPALMRERAVPGVSLAIVQDGRLAWQRSFGMRDATSQARVDADTVFEAASVSKTAFAYVALKLCERGVLALDTPLTHYT